MLIRMLMPMIASVLFLVSPAPARADDSGTRGHGLSYTMNTLVFGTLQDPGHSTQNPDNAFLELDRYAAELDLRPDLFWEGPAVSAVFKPRFNASKRWFEDGAPQGTRETARKGFVNEWRLQVKVHPALFLSFGKEKLLWGPSFLASPSNVLFKDTEKLNPKSEVEGKHLAKAIYVPNNTVTVTLIAETQQDRNAQQETIEPLQAVKADVQGGSYLVSVIGYHRTNDRFRMGSYGQWTVTDAVLLYYDGIVTKGTDALYAVADPSSPFGASFVKQYDDSGRLFATVTAGGSYTFLSGSTISVEYLYNGEGYDDAEAAAYYSLRRIASDHFFDTGPLSGLSLKTLSDALSADSQFLRRHYLMGQYQVREIKNALDVLVRYIHGIEENAGRASSIIEWQVSNRVQLFNINTVAVDQGKECEFNSIFKNSFLAGIEMHF